MQSEWTDDDRDVRNFFGLMASVCVGAVVSTILTVHDYSVTLLIVVGAFGGVFTAAFFGWRLIKRRVAHTQYMSLARFASDTRIYLTVVFFLVVWLVELGLLDRYRETRDFWRHLPVTHSTTANNREAVQQWPVLSRTEIDDWGRQLAEFKPKIRFVGVAYFGDSGQPLAVTLATAFKKAGWPDPDLTPQEFGRVGMHIGYPSWAPELRPVADKIAKLLHHRFQIDVPIEGTDNSFIVYIGLLPPFYVVGGT